MANTISAYSKTANSNNDLGGINLTEGSMVPGDVSNAFRELMSHLAEMNDGTSSLTSPDINGGSVTGANLTVGSGKTLDVSAGTLTLANDQISGDKINGGSISATFVGNLTGNVTGNASGTSATVTGAAQSAITSVGTLSGLAVDSSGTAVISTFTASSSDAAVVRITNGEGTDHLWDLGVGGSGHAAGENSFYIRDQTAGSNRFIIDGSGNASLTGHLDLPDSAKVRLGNSDDLTLHHDGSNSYIRDEGTGALYLTGSIVQINNSANTKPQLACYENSSTNLFFDGSNKLATSASGITISGSLGVGTASPAYKMDVWDNDIRVYGNTGGSARLRCETNGGASAVVATDGGVADFGTTSGHTMRLLTNNTERLRIDGSTGQIGIDHTSPRTKMHIGPLSGGDATAQERLRISGDYTATNSGSLIRFTNQHDSATNPNSGEYNIAGIKAFDFASDWGGAIALQTAAVTGGGGNLVDRLVITPAGNVGIGIAAPTVALQVNGAIIGAAAKMYGSNGSAQVGDSNVVHNSWGCPNDSYYIWTLPEAGTYLLMASMRIRMWGVGGMILSRLYNNTNSEVVAASGSTETSFPGNQDQDTLGGRRMNVEPRNSSYQMNWQISQQWVVGTNGAKVIHHQMFSDNNSSNSSIQSDGNGRNSHVWYRIG